MKLTPTTLLSRLLPVLCLSFIFVSPLVAKTGEATEIPEVEGIYDVPGHPKIKLRVFVYHQAKQFSPAKPAPTPPLNPDVCIPDNPSTATVNLTGWYLKNGQTTYQLNKGSVPSTVGYTRFADLAQKSFNTWRVGTNLAANVSFQLGTDTAVSRASLDGQNIITWGRTSGSALAVTYIWAYSSGEVVETDTIFNLKFPWAWSASDTCAYANYYDAQNILTHELGHWVGLDDEYTTPYTDNTMFGYGSRGEVKKNTLTQGDIAATNLIY